MAFDLGISMASSQVVVNDRSTLSCCSPRLAECCLIHAQNLNLTDHVLCVRHHSCTIGSRSRDKSTQLFTLTDPSERCNNKLKKEKSRLFGLVRRTTKEASRDVYSIEAFLDGSKMNTDCIVRTVSQQDCSEDCTAQGLAKNVDSFGSALSLGTVKEIPYEHLLNEVLQAREDSGQHALLMPSRILFCLLEMCIDKRDLAAGKALHNLIVRSGLESDPFLGSHLIRMFALFESLVEADQVFNKLSKPDVFSWTAIISAHAKHGNNDKAIKLYHELRNSTVQPDGHAFVAGLKACATAEFLTDGKLIHSHIIECGYELQTFVGNTLIDMYAKCGSIHDACIVFDRLPKQDIVTWNAMLAGYSQHGYGHEALNLVERMKGGGLEANHITFICTLKACTSIVALDQGKRVHICIIERGCNPDVSVSSALIDMYAKCGSVQDAGIVFQSLQRRDVVTWSTFIAAYGHHRNGEDALLLLEQMQNEGVLPNQVTFVSVLKACSGFVVLERGEWIHALTIEHGFESDLFLGSTLIDMHGKCGNLDKARSLFDRLPKQDVVTWNAMMGGYAQHGHGQEALQLFHQMQQNGIEPDKVTAFCILRGCSSISAIQKGKWIHAHTIESGIDSDVCISSALIDMYGNCGSLEDAHVVFGTLQTRDVAVWNSMIAVCAQHCNYTMALQCFEDMQHSAGLKPDDVTFLCLLSACIRAGLVDEGCLHFKSMGADHGIVPTLECYVSLADLLGRGGLLNEAEDLLESIPSCSSVVGWTSLLGACRTHGNIDLGRRCFDKVVSLDPGNATGYVLMSNIYAQAGKRGDAERVEKLKSSAKVWKKPAKAFIEIENKVHEFIVGDKSHAQSFDIYAKINMLRSQMREAVDIPDLNLVSDYASGYASDMEDALCGHSEKLAIAFGLIATPRGTTIRVTKNLKMCADCHCATKSISKIELREIIIKDAFCIHHFKNGLCSCKDNYSQRI